MTVSKDLRPAIDVGFRYASLARDPEFRHYLKTIGWHSGQDVITAAEDEPLVEVLERIIRDGSSSPCMIAIELPGERFGFGMLFAEIDNRPRWHHLLRRRPEPIEISPDASIGMFYSSLRRCAEYVPNEWVKPITFERPVAQ